MPLWDVFDTAGVYSAMNSLAPEWFWGILAMVAGVVVTWGVIRNSYMSLITGSWIGFIQWLTISGLYFAGDWHNTAGITALAFALYSAYVYLNLKVNRNSHIDPPEEDESI
jgi:hypothetical protein